MNDKASVHGTLVFRAFGLALSAAGLPNKGINAGKNPHRDRATVRTMIKRLKKELTLWHREWWREMCISQSKNQTRKMYVMKN